MSIDKKINPEEILSIINDHKRKWVMDRVYEEVDKDCIKIIEEYGQQEREDQKKMDDLTIHTAYNSGYEAGKKEANEWISVKDRLPGNQEELIFWHIGLDDKKGKYIIPLDKRSKPFFQDEEGNCYYTPHVTHYRSPLPAPPQQGKETGE